MMNDLMLPKEQYIRSPHIRNAARGEECTAHGPRCMWNPETTVFAHLNGQAYGKGMGIKAHDIGMFLCAACHEDYDRGRMSSERVIRALALTQIRLIQKGVLVIKGKT